MPRIFWWMSFPVKRPQKCPRNLPIRVNLFFDNKFKLDFYQKSFSRMQLYQAMRISVSLQNLFRQQFVVTNLGLQYSSPTSMKAKSMSQIDIWKTHLCEFVKYYFWPNAMFWVSFPISAYFWRLDKFPRNRSDYVT